MTYTYEQAWDYLYIRRAPQRAYGVLCNGPADTSPRLVLAHAYDSRCSSCYLGHAHTVNLHTHVLAELNASPAVS